MYQIAERKDVKELRLRYSTTDGLKMQFVKGTRENYHCPHKSDDRIVLHRILLAESVPMEVTRYGYTVSRYIPKRKNL